MLQFFIKQTLHVHTGMTFINPANPNKNDMNGEESYSVNQTDVILAPVLLTTYSLILNIVY